MGMVSKIAHTNRLSSPHLPQRGPSAPTVHRRHPGDGTKQGTGSGAHRVPDISFGEPRVHRQSTEIFDQPHTGNRLPGSRCRLRSDGAQITGFKDQEHPVQCQSTAPNGSAHGSGSVKTAGQVDPCNPCNEGSPLFFRHLQACLQAALQPLQDYSQHCSLSKEPKEDLNWWATHPTSWNGNSIIRGNPDLTIETDASNTSWGARCGSLQTGGPWSPTKARMHIHCLELLAAIFRNSGICQEAGKYPVKMDSTSALTYINKMGGTVSPDLNRLTKDLWTWCLARNITLMAYHLPGAFNEKADEESRIMKDRSDWMLCRESFRRIQTQFGPLDIDLVSSRLTKQLPTYVSWRPYPQALETDAFSMNWKGLKACANPLGT